jgi:hypothetical protein
MCNMALAFEVGGYNSSDFYALKVLEKILGSDINETSSRLSKNIG